MNRRRGYTLVELLVVAGILVAVIGIGIAAYNTFNQRQAAVAGGKELITNLRKAQSQATSGIKPSTGCAVLDGYAVRGTAGGNTYTISASCRASQALPATYTLAAPVNYVLPAGVTFGNTFTLTFQGQAGGVRELTPTGMTTISVRAGTGITYQVQIAGSGDIQDRGLQ